VPLAIDASEHEAIVTADGRVMRQPVLTLSVEDTDRLRSGYVCIKCFEPFEQAWPERCPVCGAPVRREQARYFAQEFGGAAALGSPVSLLDELAHLAERERRG